MSDAGSGVASIAGVLAIARRRETMARVCVAGDLVATAERLADEIDRIDKAGQSSLADGGARAALAAELDETIELMRAAEVEFRFRGLGDRELSDLLAKHPALPTEPNLRFDADAMAPELVALSCVSHPMTLEQSVALHDVLPEMCRNVLFNAAWDASRGENRIPTSRAASVTTPGSAPR